MNGMNEQPGLILNESGNILRLTLGGFSDYCIMEVDGVRELRDRLDNLLSSMEDPKWHTG